MTEHYHVLAGQHGYLPDFNQYCETIEEAQQLYGEQVDYEIEQSFKNTDGVCIDHYNTDSHLWYCEIENGMAQYIEIVPCQESDCEKEL